MLQSQLNMLELRDDASPRLLTTESSQVLLLLLIPLRFGVRGPSLSVAISRVSLPGMSEGGDIVWRWRTGKPHKIPKPNFAAVFRCDRPFLV